MKKKILFIMLLLSVLLVSCDRHEPKPIDIPETSEVNEIKLEHGDVKSVCYDKNWIEEFMNVLSAMDLSVRDSVNDTPSNVDDYVIIHLICSEEEDTILYFYERNDVGYVEQPYQGVFVPEPALKTNIFALLANEDSREERQFDLIE